MNQHNSLAEVIATRIIESIGTPTSLILHTIIFVSFIILITIGFHPETVMLILTTALSIEAIYLTIFIQISLNKNNKILKEVCEEVVDIQEELQDDEE